MNLIEFVDKLNKKQEIIDRLVIIHNELNEGSCFSPDLRPGKATGFLIYNLYEFFNSVLNKKFETYLEVGVLYGGSLCSLYDSGFKGLAYGLDIYEGYYGNFNDKRISGISTSEEHMKLVHNNVKKFGGKPKLIKANTQKKDFDIFIEKEKLKELDVLLIDGDHSFEGAISDYNKLIKFLKIDGILLFDNYEMEGVKRAVNKATSTGNIETIGVWNKTCWIGIKKK
tara:strand:- start:1138 stop:1815 length:678 start_codon:yes stop_codon:yes gene_type:complete